MAGKKKPVKRGAPTKYDPDIVDYARALATDGLTNDEMAEKLGIATSTLNDWRKKHPEFSDAIKEGKDQADSKVKMSLYKRALGYSYTERKVIDLSDGGQRIETTVKEVPPDPTSGIYWTKVRMGWNDKVQMELSGPDGGPIEHVIGLTDDELEHRAKQILSRRAGNTE